MVLCLIMGGASVEQVCLRKWTATHEAAKVSGSGSEGLKCGCRSLLQNLGFFLKKKKGGLSRHPGAAAPTRSQGDVHGRSRGDASGNRC